MLQILLILFICSTSIVHGARIYDGPLYEDVSLADIERYKQSELSQAENAAHKLQIQLNLVLKAPCHTDLIFVLKDEWHVTCNDCASLPVRTRFKPRTLEEIRHYGKDGKITLTELFGYTDTLKPDIRFFEDNNSCKVQWK